MKLKTELTPNGIAVQFQTDKFYFIAEELKWPEKSGSFFSRDINTLIAARPWELSVVPARG
jgi:hypothetical protein